MNLERGIRKTVSGFQAYVRIDGEFRSKHFKPDTSIMELRRWRETQKARALLNLPADTGPGLQHDADAYLDLVKGLRSYRDRAYRILLWVAAFGPDTPMASLTALKIRQQLELWRMAGSSLGTLNLRRTAISHWFNTLHGKAAPNPVRDVPRYREPAAPLVLPTWLEADTAIKAVPDALTRTRLRVLMTTGWPASTLMRVEPGQVNWTDGIVTVPPRRKGQGIPARTLPLLPAALTALKALKKLDGFGTFDTTAMYHAMHRACKAAGVPTFNPYKLRHLFLTRLALATRDDRAVAELGLHSDVRQTRRYTEQSVSPRTAQGIVALGKALRRKG